MTITATLRVPRPRTRRRRRRTFASDTAPAAFARPQAECHALAQENPVITRPERSGAAAPKHLHLEGRHRQRLPVGHSIHPHAGDRSTADGTSTAAHAVLLDPVATPPDEPLAAPAAQRVALAAHIAHVHMV
jgi:hypothetical protein